MVDGCAGHWGMTARDGAQDVGIIQWPKNPTKMCYVSNYLPVCNLRDDPHRRGTGCLGEGGGRRGWGVPREPNIKDFKKILQKILGGAPPGGGESFGDPPRPPRDFRKKSDGNALS